jgi:hypothetical protein
MQGLIQLTEEEVASNFDFCLTLVERGHTLKIATKGGTIVMMTPIVKRSIADQLTLPEDIEEFIDPASTAQYVAESLNEMTKGF